MQNGAEMPKTTNVLDLTDLSMFFHFDDTVYPAFLRGTGCDRIYLGSYFCDKYLMKTLNIFMPLAAPFFRESGIRITLVIPVLSEQMLRPGKETIRRALDLYPDLIDEIVANDYGMLIFLGAVREECQNAFRLIAGRLFFRNYRDARYGLTADISGPMFFPPVLRGMTEAADLDLVCDRMDFSEIPQEMEIHIHYPYVYVTCGVVCEFASIRQPDSGKFRTMLPCGNACMRSWIQTESEHASYLHLGKGIYIPACGQAQYSRMPERFIYWPAEEFLRSGGGV